LDSTERGEDTPARKRRRLPFRVIIEHGEDLRRREADSDDYSDILLKAPADRLEGR